MALFFLLASPTFGKKEEGKNSVTVVSAAAAAAIPAAAAVSDFLSSPPPFFQNLSSLEKYLFWKRLCTLENELPTFEKKEKIATSSFLHQMSLPPSRSLFEKKSKILIAHYKQLTM